MNNSVLKPGRIERILMALYKRYGSKIIVILITSMAICLAQSITMIANLHQFGHLNLQDTTTYLKAFFVPLIVASISSIFLTRLVVQLDNALQIVTTLSITDHLTGSANRRGFLDKAARKIKALQAPDECQIGMVDLDNFKAINDTYGHGTGDEALQKVAGALEQQIGSHGIVGRLGGDEFAFFIHASEFELEQLKTDIRKHCTRLMLGSGIGIDCSIGMVALQPGESIDSGLARADVVLYNLKKGGPHRAQTGAA